MSEFQMEYADSGEPSDNSYSIMFITCEAIAPFDRSGQPARKPCDGLSGPAGP